MVQGRLVDVTLASFAPHILSYYTLGLYFNNINANSIIKADLCAFLYFVGIQVELWNTLTWSSAACALGCSSISVRMQQNPESYIQIPILVKEEGYQEGAHNLFLFILFHVLDHY
jgi:hypothetical protein